MSRHGRKAGRASLSRAQMDWSARMTQLVATLSTRYLDSIVNIGLGNATPWVDHSGTKLDAVLLPHIKFELGFESSPLK